MRDIDIEEIKETVSQIAQEMQEALAHGDKDHATELAKEQRVATDIWISVMTDLRQAA